jgi:L-threonylcarbamoyladenylate synthase
MGLIDKKEAILKLKLGVPVVVPTETVYGLAAPINDESALNKIFSIKKRPFSDPLIVHVSSIEMALKLTDGLSPESIEAFKKLAHEFWPGPLTIVVKKNSKIVSDLITASLSTVALRWPNSKLMQELINEVGPLAAPSANLFKSVSPTKAEHVLSELKEADVIEGTPSEIGLESTIYELETRQILRPGAITATQISKVVGTKVTYSEKLNTPGSEKDHYQPKQAVWVFESEELLKKQTLTPHTLMPMRENSKQASQCLYQDLRDCDKNQKTIFVIFKPEWRQKEDWIAYENRLLKASSKWFSIQDKHKGVS